MADDGTTRTPLALQDNSTPGGGTPFPGRIETRRPRYLIVVSREQPDLWRHLRQLFTGIDGVNIVLDRRHGGRWQWAQSRAYEDRGEDRRRPRNLDAGLSHRSFVIVNPDETGVTPPAA
ncbi:MAG: hypothetical protein H6Q87_72 [candidate division NC10 bacterium]|nr:hypothetical protein [candidate division NC10 bacterium]MBS1115688.1 hypothetical protein [candidate division NC10 bacterium]